MAEHVSGIYRIINVVSGRFYVGSSESIYRRFEAHRRHLRAGKHTNVGLQLSWSKHGESAFKFEILQRVEPDGLRLLERRILVPLLSHPACCNMHDETYTFPRTGAKHSDETKALISAKVQAAIAEGRGGKFIPSEETRAKMSAALMGNKNAKGHGRTEDHRRKLSAAMKGKKLFLGRKHSDESRAKMGVPIRAISPGGQEKVYPRTTAVKEEMGIFLPTVLRSIRSGAPLSKGPHEGWRFEYA